MRGAGPVVCDACGEPFGLDDVVAGDAEHTWHLRCEPPRVGDDAVSEAQYVTGMVGGLVANTAAAATCPNCDGHGERSEHDPSCRGFNCEHQCPIQVQCVWCHGTGKVPESGSDDLGDPDDEPF